MNVMLLFCLKTKEVLLPASPINFTQALTSKAVEQQGHLPADAAKAIQTL